MPGFFGKQSVRLLREMGKWTADLLAQELFAMFGEKTPMGTDQQVIIIRDGTAPAIKIIDNDGTTPPIVIVRPDGTEEPFPQPGDIGGGGGTGGDGGGIGDEEDEEDEGVAPLDPVTPAPPPEPGGFRTFTGFLRVRLKNPPPDPYGFNNQQPVFSGTGCFSGGGPGTAQAFPDISEDLERFIAGSGVQSYEVVEDVVVGPGAPCTPSGPPQQDPYKALEDKLQELEDRIEALENP